MPTGAKLNGAKQFAGKLRRIKGSTFLGAVQKALYQETQIEATEVKRRTPVDTGNLRASIFVAGPFVTGGITSSNARVYTKIVAGGTAAPYAVYVHENLEAFHKVGQAKYLESVIMESRAYMGARIARRIQLNEIARNA